MASRPIGTPLGACVTYQSKKKKKKEKKKKKKKKKKTIKKEGKSTLIINLQNGIHKLYVFRFSFQIYP